MDFSKEILAQLDYVVISVHSSFRQSREDMTKRIDSTDFAFFITAVLIQRTTGGDLSEVLKNIS